MLVLTRKPKEKIVLPTIDTAIQVLEIKRGKVRSASMHQRKSRSCVKKCKTEQPNGLQGNPAPKTMLLPMARTISSPAGCLIGSKPTVLLWGCCGCNWQQG